MHPVSQSSRHFPKNLILKLPRQSELIHSLLAEKAASFRRENAACRGLQLRKSVDPARFVCHAKDKPSSDLQSAQTKFCKACVSNLPGPRRAADNEKRVRFQIYFP